MRLVPARITRWRARAGTAAGVVLGVLRQSLRWLFTSRETTNYTYDLEPRNTLHLACLIAEVLGVRVDDVLRYLDELEADAELRQHIAAATAAGERRRAADPRARYGRRAGWYAFVRLLKPRVVVETGVDKGLGACVLAAALLRNQAEGHPGRYYGTDIDPRAGWLFTGAYRETGELLHRDSLEALRTLPGPIDLFINDSDHSVTYEAREYEAIAGKLSERAIILGDNAHATDALLEFSRAAGRSFVYFQERPSGHWYPGAGIGISFRRRSA